MGSVYSKFEDNQKTTDEEKEVKAKNMLLSTGESLGSVVLLGGVRNGQESIQSKHVEQTKQFLQTKDINRSGNMVKSVKSDNLDSTIKCKYAKDSKTGEESRAWIIARIYESFIRTYRQQPMFKYWKKDVLTDKATRVLLRAADHADKLGMDYYSYIRAQFWWFHDKFARAPNLNEIASYKTKIHSSERARVYRNKVKAGYINEQDPIISKAISPKRVAKEVRFQQSEITLQKMMDTFDVTEEQVFKVFSKQIFSYFDREWLRQQPTYLRLKKSGEI